MKSDWTPSIRRLADFAIGLVIGLALFGSVLRARAGSSNDNLAPARTGHEAKSPGLPSPDASQRSSAPEQEPPDGGPTSPDQAAPVPAGSNANARRQVIETLSGGTEAGRLDAVKKLGILILNDGEDDSAARTALSKTVREDPSENVRAAALKYFWALPDDGFELYLDRLLFDTSDAVREEAIALTKHLMWPGEYAERLRFHKVSDRYTKEELSKIASSRLPRTLDALRRVSALPGKMGEYARVMAERIGKAGKSDE